MTDSTAKPAPRIMVLGVGNTTMGDDAFGAAVLRALEDLELPSSVDVVVDQTAGMHLVKHFRDSDVLFFVDGMDCGAEPGAIFRFTPGEAGIDKLRSNNIHGMGLSYLVWNAQLLGAQPEVIVYAVQVGEVMPSYEGELTEMVRRAVTVVAGKIAQEIEERLASHVTP